MTFRLSCVVLFLLLSAPWCGGSKSQDILGGFREGLLTMLE